MSPEFAQALESAAVLGAVVRPLLVATLLVGLWYALARARLTVRQRVFTWSVVAAVLIVWLAAIWTLAARGIFEPAPGTPAIAQGGMIVVPLVLLVASALTVLMRSRTIAAAIDAAPLWWLVAYQGYRVTGFIFVRLWADGFLPSFFALPAGIGDALTGAFAIGAVVALLRKSPWAQTFAYAVNIFGLADLVNALAMGLLSIFTSNGVSPLLMYPIPIVPTFGVPLAVIVHCLSLWQLHRRSRASSDGTARIEHAFHSTA
jgi:hypothetical protein